MFHVKRGPIDNLTGDGNRPPRALHKAEGKTVRPAGADRRIFLIYNVYTEVYRNIPKKDLQGARAWIAGKSCEGWPRLPGQMARCISYTDICGGHASILRRREFLVSE